MLLKKWKKVSQQAQGCMQHPQKGGGNTLQYGIVAQEIKPFQGWSQDMVRQKAKEIPIPANYTDRENFFKGPTQRSYLILLKNDLMLCKELWDL